MKKKGPEVWEEARRRCRLSEEEVRMAKELGMGPYSLIKNIPAPSQQWKAPVKEWVRSLHEKKFGHRIQQLASPPKEAPPPRPIVEFRNAEYPWPDKPEIPQRVIYEDDEDDEDDIFSDYGFSSGPPEEEDIDDENILMLRRQCLFRWAAQIIAILWSRLPEVEKVVAFGAVAGPLKPEVPRFREFRRYGVEVLHECGDLDLAVWTSDLSRLKELQRELAKACNMTHDSAYGGVAHLQVDVHVFDAANGEYRGRLCIYGECPKPGKLDCLVPNCGAEKFLRQFRKYRFAPPRFESTNKAVLFDRATGFLVRPPDMDVPPTKVVRRTKPWREEDEGDEDVPF